MGRQIKRPELEATSPPFFELDVGHRVKILPSGHPEPFWVRVLDIADDQMLGVVTNCPDGSKGEREFPELRLHDVIEFESRHVFGLF